MNIYRIFPTLLLAMAGGAAFAASGTAQDNAYAAKLWQVMAADQLVGEQRIRSYPFVGNRPHGSIQDVIVTDAVVDGHRGRLIVKHNYGAKEGLTPQGVHAAGPAQYLEAVTVMFQREAGYDPENQNWFWAEYDPDGRVIEYQGKDLSGRSELCIGCHTALGGKDREILNGKQR